MSLPTETALTDDELRVLRTAGAWYAKYHSARMATRWRKH